MLAIDQTLKSTPNLHRLAPFLELKGKFRLFPILAIIASCLLFGIGSFTTSPEQAQNVSSQATATLRKNGALLGDVDFSQTYTSSWSVVGVNLDPIFSSVQNRTSIEKDILLAPYNGRVVIITGIVDDVARSNSSGHEIDINLAEAGPPYAYLSFKIDASIESVKLKRPGDEISAKCKIESLLGGNGLKLHECTIQRL